MAYIQSHAPTMQFERMPGGTDLAERRPEWGSPLDRKTTSKVINEATLETIGHLNDQQLEDIGIWRKPRRSTWQPMARGLPPMERVEFDYFWLDV